MPSIYYIIININSTIPTVQVKNCNKYQTTWAIAFQTIGTILEYFPEMWVM